MAPRRDPDINWWGKERGRSLHKPWASHPSIQGGEKGHQEPAEHSPDDYPWWARPTVTFGKTGGRKLNAKHIGQAQSFLEKGSGGEGWTACATTRKRHQGARHKRVAQRAQSYFHLQSSKGKGGNRA